MTASLYQRLGGAAGIAAIIDDAVDRHAANPVLESRFRGRDLPQLKSLAVSFVGAGAGGLPQDEARGLQTAHASLRLSEDELTAVIGDVAAAMLERGVGSAEVGEVVGLFRAAHPAAASGTNEERPLRTLGSGGSDGGPADPQRRTTT